MTVHVVIGIIVAALAATELWLLNSESAPADHRSLIAAVQARHARTAGTERARVLKIERVMAEGLTHETSDICVQAD